MYPSDFVEEVLSSLEFKTWVPDEQIDVDLDNWSSYGFAALASLAVGSVITIFFFRDLSIFWAGLFGSSTACFGLYWILMGFGRGRVFIANDEEFDIRTHYNSIFRGRWDEVLEVRKVGRLGFEVVTAKGSATLWWSPYHILNSGYPSFTYHLFRAMALGMRRSRFKAFRIPTVLEEGKSFHYSIPSKSKTHFLFGCTVTFVGLIQLVTKLTLPPHKPLEWIIPIVF